MLQNPACNAQSNINLTVKKPNESQLGFSWLFGIPVSCHIFNIPSPQAQNKPNCDVILDRVHFQKTNNPDLNLMVYR